MLKEEQESRAITWSGFWLGLEDVELWKGMRMGVWWMVGHGAYDNKGFWYSRDDT